MPVVSILMPVRNARPTLDACIDSVRNQSEQDWECVIFDDGSTDGSREAASVFAEAEPRLRVLSGPADGLVAALNTGLDHCHGEFIARMDADDVMHPRRLEQQLAALRADAGLEAVGSHVRMFPETAVGEGMRAYERWVNGIKTEQDVRREAYVECPIVHPTLLARREFLLQLGYRDRNWPEDYDLILRMLQTGRVGVVPETLHEWRQHQGKHSLADRRYSIENFTRCKAAFLVEGLLAKTDDYLLWGYGNTGRMMRRALAEYDRHPTTIIELHPGRLGQQIHGANVVSPDEVPKLQNLPLLVSVAGEGPRNEIRQSLERQGYKETRDFVCVA